MSSDHDLDSTDKMPKMWMHADDVEAHGAPTVVRTAPVPPQAFKPIPSLVRRDKSAPTAEPVTVKRVGPIPAAASPGLQRPARFSRGTSAPPVRAEAPARVEPQVRPAPAPAKAPERVSSSDRATFSWPLSTAKPRDSASWKAASPFVKPAAASVSVPVVRPVAKPAPSMVMPGPVTTETRSRPVAIPETAKVHPVKAEPVKAEPVKAEPSRLEPIMAEAAMAAMAEPIAVPEPRADASFELAIDLNEVAPAMQAAPAVHEPEQAIPAVAPEMMSTPASEPAAVEAPVSRHAASPSPVVHEAPAFGASLLKSHKRSKRAAPKRGLSMSLSAPSGATGFAASTSGAFAPSVSVSSASMSSAGTFGAGVLQARKSKGKLIAIAILVVVAVGAVVASYASSGHDHKPTAAQKN